MPGWLVVGGEVGLGMPYAREKKKSIDKAFLLTTLIAFDVVESYLSTLIEFVCA